MRWCGGQQLWAGGSEHPQGKRIGLDALRPHGIKNWSSLLFCMSQWMGLLEGRWAGRRLCMSSGLV